nr:hypothetical protein [Spirosoma montaniterrae]
MDIAAFGKVLSQYGYKQFFYVAPVVSSFEQFLGFAMIFVSKPPKISFLAFLYLIMATLIQTIGYTVFDIQDSYCFGSLLTLSPMMAFLKNIIMLGACLWIWTSYPAAVSNPRWSMLRIGTAGLFSLVALTIGTFEVKAAHDQKKDLFTGKDITSIQLNRLIPVPKVDSYAVFFFLPSCSHCQEAVPDVKRYEENGNVKTLIGVYPSYVSKSEIEAFKADYGVTFSTYACDIKALNRFVKTYPTVLRVKGTKIVEAHIGSMNDTP